MNYLNGCIWRATAGGTGDFVVASPITGYVTPAMAINPTVVDGGLYRYRAQSDDLTQWEHGYGIYDVGTSTLTRLVILDSSNVGLIVTFSAAPGVAMGLATANDIAFYGSENVTTDNTTPAIANVDVYITNITTDGSGLEQLISLPSQVVGVLHLISLQTQTDPSDVVKVVGLQPADFLMGEDGFVLARSLGQGQWQVITAAEGTFDDVSSTYPRAYVINFPGNSEYLPFDDFADFYLTDETVTIVGGTADANPTIYKTSIITDGSAGAQTINITPLSLYIDGSRPHLFRLETQTDPADIVTITATAGIVNSEIITLPSVGAWAILEFVNGGWLPIQFGGGATSSFTDDRVLTRADTGELTLEPGESGVTNPMTADLDVGGFSIIGADGVTGGSIAITSGEGSVNQGGNIYITCGNGESEGGAFAVLTGDSTTGNGGEFGFAAGQGEVDGGNAFFGAGSGITGNGGKLTFEGGEGGVNGGEIEIRSGEGLSVDGGNLTLTAGNGVNQGGGFTMQGGNGDIGGPFNAFGGSGVNSNGGDCVFNGGTSSVANGGSVQLSGGEGAVDGGDIVLNGAPAGSGRQGLVILTNLPTSDPGVSGALYSLLGVLRVSP